MAWLFQLIPTATLAGIGATAASAAPALSTAASLGTSIYGAVQASKPPPKLPMSLDEKRSLLAQRLASGRNARGEQGLAATTLTGARGDLSVATVGKRTLLGG